MALVSCFELWDGNGGSADKDGKARYTRRWEIRTDDPLDGPKTVSAHPDIPARGSPYVTDTESDPLALAQDAQVERSSEDPTLWYVSVTYQSSFDWPTGIQPAGAEPSPGSGAAGGSGSAPEPGEQEENPLNRPPVWRCSFQTTQKVAEKTFAGNAILNAAGLPFDPPLMRDVSYPVITLTRNQANPPDERLLQDAVNDAEWCGRPERSVRVTGLEYGPKYENGTAFFEVTYQLSIKYPNWDFEVLNAGYTELSGGAWVAITDANGRPPTEPVPLDVAGAKLDPDDDPTFLTFRIYPERDFGTLIF